MDLENTFQILVYERFIWGTLKTQIPSPTSQNIDSIGMGLYLHFYQADCF